jgi:VanZ family protein
MRARATSLGPRVLDAALWSIAVGLLAATFVLSLDVAPPGLNTFFASDKLIHAAGYAALAGSWLLAAVWRPGRGIGTFPHAAWAIVLGAVVLGAGIEVGQRFVHRNADPFDVLADAGGVLVAAWAWVALRRRAGMPAAGPPPAASGR